MAVLDIVNIEQELQRLWDENHGKGCIHASLFNLIIYTQNNARNKFFRNLVKSLISKFPCRVVFITGDEKREGYLHVDVNAEVVVQGTQQICCEQIDINVSGKEREKVPFLILPHLIPDLPVYLLCAQDPSIETEIFPYLSPFVKRIIFDSESAIVPQAFFKAILALIKEEKSDISDLGWTSLAPFRKIISSVFNNKENLRKLAKAHHLRIHYNDYIESGIKEKNSIIRALYLQGWIAAQLGWAFCITKKNDTMLHIIYQTPEESQVTVELIWDEVSEVPTGAITSFEIVSSENQGHYLFKRNPYKPQIAIHQSDADQCFLPILVTLPLSNPGQEIIEELFHVGTGQHYKNMLNIVSKISY